MQNTTLAILWHMHQPYYRDMVTGEATMPWVRLHGIHSYYDMLRLYEKFPNVNGTINFVPSLVEQLIAYTEGKGDTFLEHTLAPAEGLNPQQKAFILRYFFMANTEHKILPYPAYHRLFTRRGLEPARIDFQQAIRFFSTQDYLDMQVYYNLVWFGFAAREEIPEIDALLARDGQFREEDKKFVISAQFKILKNLLNALARAKDSKNVEISTTPYYHPIFPLLLDTNYAERANSKVLLPPQVKLPAIAKSQLTGALDAMGKWTGRRPQGVWPAEGSVCPEMIPILADAGVKWMASDDRILGKSEKNVSPHEPYAAQFEGKTMNMVFRDHGLSDLIGFTYCKMPVETAVRDFLGSIKKIGGAAKGGKRLVTVILDGENPWEYYPDSGKEFLTKLFSAIEQEKIPTAAIGNYLRENPPSKTIDSLYTGSWIDANFNIWIGKPQKNTAWNYIKRALDELAPNFNESFSAACGSDWFWWYDDDFDSAFKPDFDRLFRQHLKNAFTLAGRDIPLFLFEPIYHFTEESREEARPVGFMEPLIDGKRTSFFEWANALRFGVRGRGGAIALSSEPFESISFGFNTGAFFLRIDPPDAEKGFTLADNEDLVIYIDDKDKHFKLCFKNMGQCFDLTILAGNGSVPPSGAPVKWAAEKVLEIGIPFAEFSITAGEKLTVAIALHRHGVEARRYSHIHFTVPDETYEQRMWSV